jgi:hypothetical protein
MDNIEMSVSSISLHDDNLFIAQDLFRQGNFPQAEIYARRSLAINGSNSGAVVLLDDLRRAYGLANSFELVERENRYLLIKSWGYGFWSEVHHLLIQLLLAELNQRIPIILWGRNCLFRNDSDINAFGHFFQEVSSARIEDVPEQATIYPSKWHRNNLYEENVNKWEGEGSRLAAQYLYDRPETLLVSDFYSSLSSIIPWIGRSSKYYGLSVDELYYKLFNKYLKPIPSIASKVDAFYAKYMNGRNWVGVHIRGSDKVLEAPEIAKTNASYVGFIDRAIQLNPTIGIFLLTDSSVVMDEFMMRYKDRLLSTQATRDSSDIGVHNSGLDGVVIGEEVLVDALLALKCDYFIGNKESNVSLAISSMRNWPQGYVFLLGSGNVRGENIFLHQKQVSSPFEDLLNAPEESQSLAIDNNVLISTKRVIQTFKAPSQWVNSPPGLGDFVRGACHLFEELQACGVELRIDVSQTGFFNLIKQDPSIFHLGEASRAANADEYFVDHIALHNRLNTFLHSKENELYVCTNLGAWNRLTLPDNVRAFIQKFYCFTDEVEIMTAQALQISDYEVLSLRCGDNFYSDPTSKVRDDVMRMICSTIEQHILPRAKFPVVVTSDCHELKCEIAKRYGMLMLPHQSQHGAFGNAIPVAIDLCMLKNSRFNYHINSWASWWSGFSHYTSIIFKIPSMNFCAPQFVKEEISSEGILQIHTK